eukprot:2019855-Pyramimonas_sp.AAC.2
MLWSSVEVGIASGVTDARDWLCPIPPPLRRVWAQEGGSDGNLHKNAYACPSGGMERTVIVTKSDALMRTSRTISQYLIELGVVAFGSKRRRSLGIVHEASLAGVQSTKHPRHYPNAPFCPVRRRASRTRFETECELAMFAEAR